MNIKLTKEIIKKQALLIQKLSTRTDSYTGDDIQISLGSCYKMIAETYGFNNWITLSAKLEREKSHVCDINKMKMTDQDLLLAVWSLTKVPEKQSLPEIKLACIERIVDEWYDNYKDRFTR